MKQRGLALMKRAILFPLKYKFLGVLSSILLSALGLFFYFAYETFSEDKKLFVMDLNLTLLKAITAEIKTELKGRLEELQIFVPRVYSPLPDAAKSDPFAGLSPLTKDELLSISFYRATAPTQYGLTRQWTNNALFATMGVPATLPTTLEQKHPTPLSTFDATNGVAILNRSVTLDGGKVVPVVSFVVPGTFLGDESKEMLIVVDYLQGFLRKLLTQSELAEVFLVFKNGHVLAHPSEALTVANAAAPLAHPIVARLKEPRFARESAELDVDGEPYLCNLSETGFKDLFAVSQTRKSEAFLALQVLLEKSILIAAMILAVSLLVSLFFAGRLTSNIGRLRDAAEQIGSGNFDLQIDVRSRDEVREVAASFKWMADRITTLISETAEKARLADELETARLVQSTLLTPPRLPPGNVDIVAHYSPATECGGDYWDAALHGNKLTVFIGDATGHGAPAAIVTAVAKSCFATLSALHAEHPMQPEQLLEFLNRIIHASCQGKLLMTMCILQLDTETGELLVANAGHESPFRFGCEAVNPQAEDADKNSKLEVDVLFARGERLGFNPEERYTSEKTKLSPGDAVLLYTDGISEAKDGEGNQWGERALKKALTENGARPLAVIRKELVTAFESHVGTARVEDDVTFVLVGWKRSVEEVAVVAELTEKVTAVEVAEAKETPPAIEAPEEELEVLEVAGIQEGTRDVAMEASNEVDEESKQFDETGVFEMPILDVEGRKPGLLLNEIPETVAEQMTPAARGLEEVEWREMYLSGGRDWPNPDASKRPKKVA